MNTVFAGRQDERTDYKTHHYHFDPDMMILHSPKDFTPTAIQNFINTSYKWNARYNPKVIRPYQLEFAHRVIKSVVAEREEEVEEIPILMARQIGKTETVGDIIELCSVLPSIYEPMFERGIRIGIFGPKKEQADLPFDRFKERLYTGYLNEFWGIKILKSNSRKVELSNMAVVKSSSASPNADIEGETHHLIIVEECQDVTDLRLLKSVFPMGAACVCQGTRILDCNGKYRDITEAQETILGYQDHKVKVNRIKGYGTTGTKECYRITTNSGRTLECSHDHPILIKDRRDRKLKWKEAIALRPGTQIAIADRIPEDARGNKTFFDARLVGMLIGDGSYRKGGMVRYCSCDYELLEYVKLRYEFKVYNSYVTKQDKVFEDGTIKGLCGKLREIGIYGQVGEAKRLPNDIESYSRIEIQELLGGFFDTDGCVTTEQKRRGRIYLDSCSQGLLWDVFYQLEKMGIHSRIYHSKPSGTNLGGNGVYRLVISERESILRFHKQIHFLIHYKQKKLDDLITILSKRKSKRQKNMDGLYFERVTQVKDIGKQTVYNLTAEPTNTYLANNIITHNTNATIVLIGSATPESQGYFFKATTHPVYQPIIVDDDMAMAQMELRDLRRYKSYRDKMMHKMGGPQSALFLSQFKCKWPQEGINFIGQETFYSLRRKRAIVTSYQDPAYAGIDVAKSNDDSVVTVQDEKGNILGWLCLEGMDYKLQYSSMRDYLMRFPGIVSGCIDTLGPGAPLADWLMADFGWLEPLPMSGKNKSIMYGELLQDIIGTHPVITYPGQGNEDLIRKFEDQFIKLQKTWTGTQLKVHHPKSSWGRDDFPDSLSLSNHARHMNEDFFVGSATG